MRWNKQYDGTKESLMPKSHRPHSPHPNAHTEQEIKWIKDYHRRNPNISLGDLYCHTDEEREYSAKITKETEDVYSELSYLQYEFMEDHEKIADGVFKTTYSDGSYVIVDYNEKPYNLVRG